MLKLDYIKDELIERYQNGESIKKISKDINEYPQAVSNVLKKYITLRPKIHYEINENYFETIDTEAKAYYLGFIVADGSIVNNGSNVFVLTITIHNKDISVLEGLTKDIETNKPLQHLKRNQVRFVIARKKSLRI